MKLRKPALFLAAAVLLGLILELLLRLHPAVQFRLAEKQLHCPASFYFRLCPDQHVLFQHPSGFSFTVTTNKKGERITSDPATANGDRNAPPEIWILGDSIAMGYGVSDEATFPYLLQSRLRKKGSNISVPPVGLQDNASEQSIRVANLGVDSMGTVAMADLLNNRIGHPGHVFWPFSPSDFIDDPAEMAIQASPWKQWMFQVRAALTKRSAIFAYLKQLRESGRRDAYLAGSVVGRDHPTFQGILNLDKLVKSRGSRLCVVLYQDVQRGSNKPEKSNAVRDDVAGFLHENSICTIDARAAFLSYPGHDLYLPNDGHPAEAAQRLIAEAIINFLVKR
ncbi:MAG: hypothetical protein JNM27_08580 [Leptospirales bacterium]|nr:hypothetical protein [Leptospirales bacterium]